MHIVVLTGSYFPYTSPPAVCIKPYLLELAKEHEVEIVCPSSDTHYTQTHMKDNIKINYINSLPNMVLSYIRTNQEEHHHSITTKLLWNTYRGLRFLKSLVCITPFEKASLIKPCVKKLQAINEKNKIDLLISVSFSFSNHVAALEFKKLHTEIKWITYTTDPLAYNETNRIEKWKWKTAFNIEQEVYSTCDFCITTEEMYYNIVNDYHISPKKVLGLPYLLLDKALQGEQTSSPTIPLIVYAGYLYYEIRNPRTMLEIFSRIKNVDLRLYVAGDRHIRQMLSLNYPDNISIDGLKSRENYLKIINNANVLINICNKVKLQAPSKLMELISIGKPIINFYYNKDTSFQMIEKYPLGINISMDADYDDAAAKIRSYISENFDKRIPFKKVMTLYPEHTLATQMQKIQLTIEKLTINND